MIVCAVTVGVLPVGVTLVGVESLDVVSVKADGYE